MTSEDRLAHRVCGQVDCAVLSDWTPPCEDHVRCSEPCRWPTTPHCVRCLHTLECNLPAPIARAVVSASPAFYEPPAALPPLMLF